MVQKTNFSHFLILKAPLIGHIDKFYSVDLIVQKYESKEDTELKKGGVLHISNFPFLSSVALQHINSVGKAGPLNYEGGTESLSFTNFNQQL